MNIFCSLITGISVEYGYGPKCFPTNCGAFIPQKMEVCPVPLCGNPSTPILASTGKMTPFFLFIMGLSSDGTAPKNSVNVLNLYLKKGLYSESFLPMPTPSMKSNINGFKLFVHQIGRASCREREKIQV